MMKKMFLKMPIISCMLFLFFVVACASNVQTSIPGTSNGTQTTTQIFTTPTLTISPAGFAATVGSSGNPVNRSAQGNNLTTINSPVDRPVAKFSETILNVPPQAKGNVYIQNDSDNPMTLVSDTPDGFAPFTIAPNTSTTLVFHRVGTFKAHLKDYPISADTTITISITIPSPD